MTERDPNGLDGKTFGAKLDAGKSPVRRGLLEYFPRACMAVAGISAFGAEKYTWGGWQGVPDGINRYGDAELRHVCLAVIQGEHDSDSKKLHAAHEAWNALARLEFILREHEQEAARLLQADTDDAVASLQADTEAPEMCWHTDDASPQAVASRQPKLGSMVAMDKQEREYLDFFCTAHQRWYHSIVNGGCPSCAKEGSITEPSALRP